MLGKFLLIVIMYLNGLVVVPGIILMMALTLLDQQIQCCLGGFIRHSQLGDDLGERDLIGAPTQRSDDRFVHDADIAQRHRHADRITRRIEDRILSPHG